MLPLGLDIFLVLLFLILHAFFSSAETSVLGVRKSRLREVIEDEDALDQQIRKAKILLDFKLRPENFIATVQTGAVFSGFLAATFTGFIAYSDVSPFIESTFHFSNGTSLLIAFLIMVFLVTVLDLTFGALIPKSLSLHKSETIAFAEADILRLLAVLFNPLTHLPVVISNFVLKPFRDKTSFTESRMSEEEFRVMLEEGARSGVIDKTENELIGNIFDFRERTAREIMVPRIKIVAIDSESPHDTLVDRIISEGYTRLPVFQGTIDNILGVIYSKDVLALIENPDLILLYDIIRPLPFVPETKLIAELLREFQIQKLHMAVVVDEFGGMAGIITLEDILEEIVGEIDDEYDEETPEVQLDPENRTAVLLATLSIADANEHLERIFPDFRIPDDEEYESVSGYVNKLFGYIPEVAEEHATHGLHVVVVKRAPSFVIQVRFEDRRPRKALN
jgi:CBS domain containing-hemolysin-like protein